MITSFQYSYPQSHPMFIGVMIKIIVCNIYNI